MNYILVGKQSATLGGIKSMLGDNVTVCNTIAEMDDNRGFNSKLIYIKTPIPFDWEWWMSADISNEYNRKKFINEIMDFRNIDEDCCDLKLNFDGTGVTDMIDSINKYITEVENGSN